MKTQVILNKSVLRSENTRYQGTGGVSAENRSFGFRPAFRDTRSGQFVCAQFADGRPASFHCLEGLPLAFAAEVNARCEVVRLKRGVESGFVREGQFFTRAEAAALLAITVEF